MPMLYLLLDRIFTVPFLETAAWFLIKSSAQVTCRTMSFFHIRKEVQEREKEIAGGIGRQKDTVNPIN